jgi:hypothetical protein
MTINQLLEELKELKAERLADLAKINVKHDCLVEQIAELNYLIGKAEEDNGLIERNS